MSEAAWVATSSLGVPIVGVIVLYLRKRLRLVDLSDEAATAVKITTKREEKPSNRDQALIFIAEKMAQQGDEIEDLKKRDNAWAMFTWELEHWGLRGWARSPKPHEPMPARPARLRPDEAEYPARSLSPED